MLNVVSQPLKARHVILRKSEFQLFRAASQAKDCLSKVHLLAKYSISAFLRSCDYPINFEAAILTRGRAFDAKYEVNVDGFLHCQTDLIVVFGYS
jgi:hypothetical protein